MKHRWMGLVLLGMTWGLVGCGGNERKLTPDEMERSKSALVTCLETWKGNKPTDKLQGSDGTIVFSDDYRKSHALADFTVGAGNPGENGTIAYSVSLKLKDRKGKEETRESLYLIQLGNPIRVARDPYN